MNKKGGAVIGLDFGSHRIGVARGDIEVKIASPIDPILNNEETFEEIAEIVKNNNCKTIVVGLPIDAAGNETEQTRKSMDFGFELANKLNLEVVFQDESLTSVVAEANLRSRKGFQESMLRDGTLDSESAALILSDFLEGGHRG